MDQKNEGHLDLRQRKTRALLVKALAELMEERPFSELSVVDICSRAMVHRTTFYAHFNDKRELLSYLFSQLEQECVETCLPKEEITSPKDYFLTAAKNTLEFFQRRRSLYLSSLTARPRSCAASCPDPPSGTPPRGWTLRSPPVFISGRCCP